MHVGEPRTDFLRDSGFNLLFRHGFYFTHSKGNARWTNLDPIHSKSPPATVENQTKQIPSERMSNGPIQGRCFQIQGAHRRKEGVAPTGSDALIVSTWRARADAESE